MSTTDELLGATTPESLVQLKRIRKLSNETNDAIYEQRKYLIGRILTIVDSAISDPTQRKATKDLINEVVYSSSYWNDLNMHFDWFARAEGFKSLYAGGNTPLASPDQPINPYLEVK